MAGWFDFDFYKYHVEKGVASDEFISSKSILIAAVGDIDDSATVSAGSVTAYPIGFISNWNLVQNQMLQRIFEVGSALSYVIPGNVVGSVQIARIVVFGATLLARLIGPNIANNNITSDDLNLVGFTVPNAGTRQTTTGATIDTNQQLFAINLASKAFNIPINLAWIFKTNKGQNAGAFIVKDAMVEAHSIGGDSNSVILMETANMQFEKIVPVQIT